MTRAALAVALMATALDVGAVAAQEVPANLAPTAVLDDVTVDEGSGADELKSQGADKTTYCLCSVCCAYVALFSR